MSSLLDLRSPVARPAGFSPAAGHRASPPHLSRATVITAAMVALVAALAGVSLTVGATDLSREVLVGSRIPRTLAVLLAGSAMSIGGLLMQLLVRNRFVEPATVGTTESAGVGLLATTILAPGLPMIGKMGIAIGTALLGTLAFLRILRAVPPRSAMIVVPLVGIMFAGVITSMTTFVAYRTDMLATLQVWMTGDFSGAVRGRFELLWIVAVVLVITYAAADRFTVASLGREHATGLGLNHRRVLALGMTLVAITSAVCVVVVGALPFLGLVVPNIVSMIMGDQLRRSLPVVALTGSAFVLVCDLMARVVNHPFEVPVGVIVGIVGGAVFLVMLLRQRR